MKTIHSKYPKYCNLNTGLCVIPVQFFEPIDTIEGSCNYEFL